MFKSVGPSFGGTGQRIGVISAQQGLALIATTAMVAGARGNRGEPA